MLAHHYTYSQLRIVDDLTPQWLVQGEFLGNEGIAVRNISYTGDERAVALFENGDSSGLEIDRGIILSTGSAMGAKGPNNAGGHTTILGKPGSPLLENFIPYRTLDAAMLQFDFKPQTSQMVFNYVFSSEEYIEWVDSGFNDIFGFFISGPGITGEQNVALLPDSSLEVTIDNVNHLRNTAYFVRNDDPSDPRFQYLQADGQTITLQAELNLIPCQWYTIKLAIADVSDPEKDSWVFIESKSFKHKTNLVNDTSFCDDNFQLVLDAANTDLPVKWSTGDTTHKILVDTFGVFYVDVFTGCGSFRDHVKITHQETVFSLGDDTAVCGNEVMVTFDQTGLDVERYLWSDSSLGSTLTVNDTGWVWLEVEKNGCTDRDSVYLDGKEIPVFDLGYDSVFCYEIDHVLNPQRTSDSRTWSTGSNDVYIRVETPGVYWATLQLNGCVYSDSIAIELAPEPFVVFPDITGIACGDDSITLAPMIPDPSQFDILWSNGSTSPAITVYEAGFYNVRVTETYCDRFAEAETEVIRADYGGGFIISNAFSPNGDEMNDVFRPLGSWLDAIEYRLVVYNRWGEQMFFSENPAEGWDGNVNGFPVESGVYLYEIILKTPCSEERIFTESGSVHLIR